MISSVGIASLIAHVAFWLLLFCGWRSADACYPTESTFIDESSGLNDDSLT